MSVHFIPTSPKESEFQPLAIWGQSSETTGGILEPGKGQNHIQTRIEEKKEEKPLPPSVSCFPYESEDPLQRMWIGDKA